MSLFKLLTPINLPEEKEKFFSSHTYNPIFKYHWTEGEVNWSELYSKNIPLKDAILSRNNKEIVNQAKELFESDINEDLLQKAHELVSAKPRENNSETADDIAQSFHKALKEFNIDYEVIISQSEGFNIRPLHVKKKILISKNPSLQFFEVRYLLKHEMLHIVRYQNTKVNDIPKSKNYLPTEEGFASFVQDYNGDEITSSIFQHAAEYAVTEIGLEGSLRDMVEYLLDIGFSKDNAWKRASRHKYGFVDTSIPGDIMKPSMYFYNAEKIRNLSIEEKLRLMVGKITISDLSQYPEYKGKFPVEQLKSYFLDYTE